MRNTIFLIFILVSLQCMAKENEVKVSSIIKRVKVFSSGAQVERKAFADIPAGESTLVFEGITSEILTSSINVSGEGNFTILGVSTRLNYLDDPKISTESMRLKNLISRHNADKKRINKNLQIYTQEEAMLIKNQSIGGTNIGVSTTELHNALDFHRSRLSEIYAKQDEFNKAISSLDSIIGRLNNQLNEISNINIPTTTQILVKVESAAALNAPITIIYLVKEAGWYPTYDMRVNDISSPLDITYKANVFQSSGEDWNDVILSISTGNPSENQILPKLEPWYLRFIAQERRGPGIYSSYSAAAAPDATRTTYIPKSPYYRTLKGKVNDEDGIPLMGAIVRVEGTNCGTIADNNGNFEISIPDDTQEIVVEMIGYKKMTEYVIGKSNVEIDLESEKLLLLQETLSATKYTKERVEVVGVDLISPTAIRGANSPAVAQSYQTTTITYDIQKPYSIINNGKTITIQLKQATANTHYVYYTIPKLEENAYLMAEINEWTDLNLIAGEVNLFFEGAFLGQSKMAFNAEEDTLRLSLGRDKGIVIKRTALKEFTHRKLISTNKKIDRAFEISIKNTKKSPIQIFVKDQLPISTDEKITIEDKEYKGAIADEKTGEVKWELNIEPGSSETRTLKYSIQYPKNASINLR